MKLDLNNINLQTLINYRKELLIAICLIIAGLLISFFATYNQINQIFSNTSQSKSEQESLTHLQQKNQALTAAQSQPEYLQKEEINKILPSAKPFLELLSNLNKVASTTSVTISDLKLSPVEIATQSAQIKESADNKKTKTKQPGSIAGVENISLDVIIKGETNQVQSFINLIEKVSPLTTVTKISLSRKYSATNVSTIAELTLKSFFFTKNITSKLEDSLPIISNVEKETLRAIIGFQPANLPNQTDIEGGGKQNLFEVEIIPEVKEGGSPGEIIRLGQPRQNITPEPDLQ